MNLLIGNTPIELNFTNRIEAMKTRALIVMAYEDLQMNGFFNWQNLLKKYPYINKAYENAKKS